MFKRLPHICAVVSLTACLTAAAPAMATDEVPAPPAAPPSSSGPAPCTDTSKPTSRISTSASRAGKTHSVRGTASDPFGCGAAGRGSVARVTVSVQRKSGKRCKYMSSRGRLSSAKSCAKPTWLSARGTSSWSLGLPKKLPRGTYVVHVRAQDSAGNVGSQHSLRVRLR